MGTPEGKVVAEIENTLKSIGRFYQNNHGSMLSSNAGLPDFTTLDDDGVFTGLEAKAPYAQPTVNQIRRALEIIQSGGRYMIAYPGFDAGVLHNRNSITHNGDYHVIELTDICIGDTEFDITHDMPSVTHGVVELICRR